MIQFEDTRTPAEKAADRRLAWVHAAQHDAAYSAILDQARSEVLGEVRERLNSRLINLSIGPGPDRDERYQDAWRAGVNDASTVVLAALADSDTTEGDDD